MTKQTKSRILIVEDSESILMALRDYLISTFEVFIATSFSEGIKILKDALQENNRIQLVIADINLQNNQQESKSGIELCREAKKLDSNIKTALITSYEINDYIDAIYQNEINQVITKHSSMSLFDIQVMAYKTISGDIFGIQKYFPDITIYDPNQVEHEFPQNKEVFTFVIRSFQDAVKCNERVSQNIEEQKGISPAVIRLILDELTTNALFKAPRDENGNFKYQYRLKGKDILLPLNFSELSQEDYFVLQYGFYNDWIIISCSDPHGTLRKKEILYRLRRHIARDSATGFPQGLVDSHGRGLFLLREHLTHLIFNLQKNQKTEVLAFYQKGRDIPYKNISIYEYGE